MAVHDGTSSCLLHTTQYLYANASCKQPRGESLLPRLDSLFFGGLWPMCDTAELVAMCFWWLGHGQMGMTLAYISCWQGVSMRFWGARFTTGIHLMKQVMTHLILYETILLLEASFVLWVLRLPASLSPFVSLSLSLSLFLSLSLSLSLSVCLSVCMFVSLCLPLSVCLSLCPSFRLSFRPSVSPRIVRVMTHHPFKLESPNLS